MADSADFYRRIVSRVQRLALRCFYFDIDRL